MLIKAGADFFMFFKIDTYMHPNNFLGAIVLEHRTLQNLQNAPFTTISWTLCGVRQIQHTRNMWSKRQHYDYKTIVNIKNNNCVVNGNSPG